LGLFRGCFSNQIVLHLLVRTTQKRKQAMHITQKGQVTIPLEIRRKFGFLPFTEVKFMVKDNQVILQKERSSTKRNMLKKQLESIRGSSKLKMSTDEIMHLLRAE